jgi:hypothetical protein
VADVQAVFEKIYRRQYYRHVPFLRLMTRASHSIARFCVYGPDDGDHKIAGRNIRRTHRLWLKRLLVLAQHNLWLPLRDATLDDYAVDVDRLESAFRRHAYCRPSFVVRKQPPARYMPTAPEPAAVKALTGPEFEAWQQAQEAGRKKSHRPCWRTNFCPHCYASIVSAQYRVFKRALNKWRNANDTSLYVQAHILEHRLYAADMQPEHFNDGTTLQAAVATVKECLDGFASYIRGQHKTLQRRTHGSLWRLVVLPDETGWRVQLRQLILADDPARLKVKPYRRARVVLNRRVEAAPISWPERRATGVEDKLADVFCAIADYPRGLLTDDPELAAVALHAMIGRRMIGGTGCLKRTGTHQIRADKRQAAAKRAAK